MGLRVLGRLPPSSQAKAKMVLRISFERRRRGGGLIEFGDDDDDELTSCKGGHGVSGAAGFAIARART